MLATINTRGLIARMRTSSGDTMILRGSRGNKKTGLTSGNRAIVCSTHERFDELARAVRGRGAVCARRV
jgi:hypothetical protein